jgi:hypothetical protein
MIKSILLIAITLLFSWSVKAQDFTSGAFGGSWSVPLFTWGTVVLIPSATDDVLISSGLAAVTVSDFGICENLEISGSLSINPGGTMTVLQEVQINTAGTLTLNGGNLITTNLSFIGSGSLNITSNNYVEVTGNVSDNGLSKITVSDGSLIIYSNLEF